jgi:hypothetical protein
MGSIKAYRPTTGLTGGLARRQRAAVPAGAARRVGGRSSMIRLSGSGTEGGDWARDIEQHARTLAHWIRTRPAALAALAEPISPRPAQAPLFAASEFGPGLR